MAVSSKLVNAWLGSRLEDARYEYYQFEESNRKRLLIFAKELTFVTLSFTGRGITNSNYPNLSRVIDPGNWSALGQTKVQHLDQSIIPDHHVFGFNIAMDDAGAMCCYQGCRYLSCYVQSLAQL